VKSEFWTAFYPGLQLFHNVFWHSFSASRCCIVKDIGLRASAYDSPWIVSHIFMTPGWRDVSQMVWTFLFLTIKLETSKRTRYAYIEIVTEVLSFTVKQLFYLLCLKDCIGLFATDSCFVVKCLRPFLALKLLLARTSLQATHWGRRSCQYTSR
jgi:hypothetical protein